MPKPKKYNFTPQDILAIKRAVYGEGASTDDATMKMIAQSIINRAKSGRSGEFGGNVNEILKKGYYAVKNPNTPYKQALSGKFPDVQSKAAWGRVQKLVDIAMSEENSGKHLFYFKPEEEVKLRKNPEKFDFKMVKPMGKQGGYNLYGY